MIRKLKNKSLPKGILIDRGYVFIRIFPDKKRFLQCLGPLSQPGIIDEAISKLNEYREQIRLGKFGLNERTQRITVEQALDIYSDLHAKNMKSARSYALSLKYIREFFRGRYIDSITYLDVQNYRREREKCVQPNSVNKEHTVLTHLFNKLKEWRRLKAIANIRLPEENPGPLVKKASEKLFTRKRVLLLEEFDRILKVAPVSVKRICLGAINTTLRLKDLKHLTKDNVNESTNQLEGIQAKTGKPYQVPINGVMRRIVDTAPNHHIFDFSNFRKLFEEARDKAHIKDFQFRDLRRTGARMMLKKGVDLATVSAYLGHTSLQMTEVYVTPSQDDKRVGGEILGSMYRWEDEPNCRKNCRKDPINVDVRSIEKCHNSNRIAPVAQLEERLRPKHPEEFSQCYSLFLPPTEATFFTSSSLPPIAEQNCRKNCRKTLKDKHCPGD